MRKRKESPFDRPLIPTDPSQIIDEKKDIGAGSWVLIKTRIPVAENVRPVTYGIYWAIPVTNDPYKRQMVKVYTPQEVCLLNYEYTPLTEERVQVYRELGYFMRETPAVYQNTPLELQSLEQGRSLCEEEREVIWALMLDGLSEVQACEEYFATHHTDASNISICFLPTEELLNEIVQVFGEFGVAG